MRAALLCPACFVLLTALADAALIERDLFEPGDGLLTYDSVNQREWLDFSVMRGVQPDSLYDSLATSSSTGDFEVATLNDVRALAETYGIDWVDTRTAGLEGWASRAAAQELVRLFGVIYTRTDFLSSNVDFAGGLVRDHDAESGVFSILPDRLIVFSDDADFSGNNLAILSRPSGWFYLASSGFLPPASDPATYWLYRDAQPIPEPAAALLILTAVAFLPSSRPRVSA